MDRLDVPAQNRKEDSMVLHTMTHTTDIKFSAVSGLQIRGYDERYVVNLPAMTTTDNEIPINRSHIPTRAVVEQWRHLRPMASKLPQEMSVNVGILLGANCNPAHVPLEIIANGPEEPYAKRTALGWCVTGNHCSDTKNTQNSYAHRIMSKDVHDSCLARKTVSFIADLPGIPAQKVLEILESDFTSTRDNVSLSIEDKLFLTILEESTKQNNSGYVTMPPPFKQRPKGTGPMTRKSAEHRFNLLLEKFKRNPEYETNYREFMNSIIENKDAELVNEEKDDAWYIPHFGVFHPKKPGKIRIVFDCAAKTRKKSLNEFLLSGPDMMNSLLGILMRFRVGHIAVSCDIERMFHQFQVEPGDRDYVRFIWLDKNNTTTTYRMKVHLFGAKSSPACATFGLRYLAEKYGNQSTAQHWIANNFYVDDGLASTDTVEAAARLVKSSVSFCKESNIHLHKFVSNNPELLETIPESEKIYCNRVNLLDSQDSIHRTLGIQWNTSSDQFTYKLDVQPNEMTRRGILSAIASTFDPLGIISPILIAGKVILQQCCKVNLGWVDSLPPELLKQWNHWKDLLTKTEAFSFPRCYKPPGFGHVVKAELHSFSDASSSAYGAAVYLKLVDDGHRTSVALVHAKARVAPISSTSIPRLELQAAVLAAVLNNFVKKQLTDYHIEKSYYYSDSQIVLGYLTNEARRFHTFVANRVQKIRDYSNPRDWYYQPN